MSLFPAVILVLKFILKLRFPMTNQYLLSIVSKLYTNIFLYIFSFHFTTILYLFCMYYYFFSCYQASQKPSYSVLMRFVCLEYILIIKLMKMIAENYDVAEQDFQMSFDIKDIHSSLDSQMNNIQQVPMFNKYLQKGDM